MRRHLPDIPWWREVALRVWTFFTRPRRMSHGAVVAIVVLVLIGIGISAFTRVLVDERVKIRIAQSCASWGADETLDNVVLSFPVRPDSQRPADMKAADDFRSSLVQARDTKLDLRAKNKCPPYPPPPIVPPIPTDRRS